MSLYHWSRKSYTADAEFSKEKIGERQSGGKLDQRAGHEAQFAQQTVFIGTAVLSATPWHPSR